MRLLNGQQLADYMKQRQAQEVRNLVQTHKLVPKLAIVVTINDPVINVYVRLKQKYGADIGVEVEVHRILQAEAPALLKQLSADPGVHGIIVQLPLEDTSKTQEIVDLIASAKDVDALGSEATLDPATPLAILWLLAGYNIDLKTKQVLLVGRGKLVGAPLEKLLQASQIAVAVADIRTLDLKAEVLKADVIISATGKPGLITSDMLKPNAVVVDAGLASEDGKTLGDVDRAVYERDDLTITPVKGGVGPLTVCALFSNVLTAATATLS